MKTPTCARAAAGPAARVERPAARTAAARPVRMQDTVASRAGTPAAEACPAHIDASGLRYVVPRAVAPPPRRTPFWESSSATVACSGSSVRRSMNLLGSVRARARRPVWLAGTALVGSGLGGTGLAD